MISWKETSPKCDILLTCLSLRYCATPDALLQLSASHYRIAVLTFDTAMHG